MSAEIAAVLPIHEGAAVVGREERSGRAAALWLLLSFTSNRKVILQEGLSPGAHAANVASWERR